MAEHPAINAWSELRPEGRPPERTSLLSKKRKSTVYLLERVDRDGAVIAKRCQSETASLERRLYEEILTTLPVETLRFHGWLEESDGEHCWLFMEEATGERYSSLVAGHRLLAARWLGLVHTAAAPLEATVDLPDRGCAHYLGHLRSLEEHIRAGRDNPMLKDRHLDVLRDIEAQCAAVESRWGRVEELCERFPRTLVHGDLSPKNVRIRSSNGDSVLLPFDWENAGWGVPAADMSHLFVPPRDHLSLRPDLEAYWHVVRGSWPRLTMGDVEQMAALGTLFRLLALIDWASWSLSSPRPGKAAKTLKVYQAVLATARREVTRQ